MTWSTSEIEYEGLPLLLRRPDYPNIWNFKEKFTQLVTAEHMLEKVSQRGLPDRVYNKSLTDFDHHMCTMLNEINKGIIFLIETFAGKRNYYYYTLPGLNVTSLMEKTKNNFNVNLKITIKNDGGWGFLKAYPIQLFS